MKINTVFIIEEHNRREGWQVLVRQLLDQNFIKMENFIEDAGANTV